MSASASSDSVIRLELPAGTTVWPEMSHMPARLDSIFWTYTPPKPKQRKRRYIERLQRKLGR